MKKRLLALVLAVAMILTMVSFASAEGTKTKLTALFIAHALTKDLNEMQWLKEIADDAGGKSRCRTACVARPSNTPLSLYSNRISRRGSTVMR